ncbi:hypothetical protein WICPIJ_001561 [Wickerhamomyces pijperi]|uniref:CUE domain-containing protein n=1 Tax=Wickerhamomyces pijperi TaxID=599730 RepID=A0A9P8TQH4_WICPI|nr:hypothetical protein WICPIJ_001561 [Wickerhamomyces pijperi]
MSNLEEFTDSRIDLPITSFPPFKLRSSMVDKDPVIWVHLIETYIQYVQLLLSNSTIQLTEKSEQQLQLFVQTYLFEIAEEQGQILSLGLINVQILQNLDSLRVYMFELIKIFGIWRLKLNNGSTLWNFAKIYALKNRTVVRAIIDGSWKSADTNSRKSLAISSINQVQKFLEQRISNAKFDKYDLGILAALLTPSGAANQSNAGSVGVSKNGKAVKKNSNNNRNFLNFNDAFVSVFWIELLEKLYANGSGRFADVCKKIGIVSVTSLNNAAIANLATQLSVTSYHTLELYPLFGGVITSEKFKQLSPGLETKMPFLGKKLRPKKKTKKYGFNKDHIQTLMDFFPSLTISKSETLLKSNNYNVEAVTNILLEDPTIIENTPDNIDSESEDEEMEEVPMASQIISKKVNLPARKHQANHVPDELKNKTLEAALRMMYEADEDERDDTYDEAEATANSTPQKMDKVEKLLFELFKTSQQHFSREERNSKYRKELKAKTKWSDEQIEGWGRMLVKDPRRFRLVEERYMNELVEERNNARRRPQETEETGVEQNSSKQTTNKLPDQKNQPNRTTEKRQQARNEKNKASKGNHNRKRGHDKKLRASMPAPV